MNPTEQPTGPDRLDALRFELISRLADDLSHEIKNPLHAMVINLELVRQRVARQRAEGVLDRIAVVDAEVRRVHRLVDGFLRVLRPAQRHSDGTPLGQLLEEVMPVLEAEAAAARARVELRSSADAAVLLGDPRCIKHCLLLLLVHALDGLAGRPGGLLLEAADDPGRIHLDLALTTDPDASAGGAEDGETTAASVEQRPGPGALGGVRAFAAAAGGELSEISREGARAAFRLSFPARSPT